MYPHSQARSAYASALRPDPHRARQRVCDLRQGHARAPRRRRGRPQRLPAARRGRCRQPAALGRARRRPDERGERSCRSQLRASLLSLSEFVRKHSLAVLGGQRLGRAARSTSTPDHEGARAATWRPRHDRPGAEARAARADHDQRRRHGERRPPRAAERADARRQRAPPARRDPPRRGQHAGAARLLRRPAGARRRGRSRGGAPPARCAASSSWRRCSRTPTAAATSTPPPTRSVERRFYQAMRALRALLPREARLLGLREAS